MIWTLAEPLRLLRLGARVAKKVEKLVQKHYCLSNVRKLLKKQQPRNAEKRMKKSKKIIEAASKKFDADIIIYSGEITIEGAEKLMNLTAKPDRDNVVFVLCTPGGDPNAAFKIGRRLQEKYKKFVLYVHGYCKSAGTFIAIASDQIIMGDFAEFGPLDVQLSEEDEIARYSSGLNVNEVLVNLKQETRLFFRQMIMELTSGAGLSTKMAAEIASKLSIDFFAPIVSQIELLKIGKIRRALKIALAYGERLIQDGRGNLRSEKALVELVENYPDHGFVIDFKEARTLFKNISKEEGEIRALGSFLSQLIKYPNNNSMIIEKIYPTREMQNGAVDQRKDTKGTRKSTGGEGSSDIANSGESVSTEASKQPA